MFLQAPEAVFITSQICVYNTTKDVVYVFASFSLKTLNVLFLTITLPVHNAQIMITRLT